MDWIVRGQMVKNFEDTSFSLKKNEISGVITTEYGFHIVQLLDKQDARLKPFDEVNPSAENLARYFYKQTVEQLREMTGGRVRVKDSTIYETDTSFARYYE